MNNTEEMGGNGITTDEIFEKLNSEVTQESVIAIDKETTRIENISEKKGALKSSLFLSV